MRRGLAAILFLSPLCANACKQKSETPAPSASPSAAPAPEQKGIPLSSPSAFELVTVNDGVALFYGKPEGGVVFQKLDGAGKPDGKPVEVAPANSGFALEIAAASQVSRLGVAWAQKNAKGEKSTLGALGDAATRSFGESFELGALELEAGDERGQLAVGVNDDGAFVALRRGKEERCANDVHGHCIGFAFREIGAKDRPERGLPLSVPNPCARSLVGFVSIGQRFHYAFCSEEKGSPAITHFMRQLSPFYVDVHRLLERCKPIGLTRVGDEALLVAECEKGREGFFLSGMGSTPKSVDIDKVELSCPLGKPKLRAPGDHPLAFDFAEARDNLAPLLPKALASAGSRAAWTGTTILVARTLRGELVIDRHECHRGLLTRMN